MELMELEVMSMMGFALGGGGGGFVGAWAANKVHIRYITRDNDRQDMRLDNLEKSQAVTDRKADRAHIRIDHLVGAQTQ